MVLLHAAAYCLPFAVNVMLNLSIEAATSLLHVSGSSSFIPYLFSLYIHTYIHIYIHIYIHVYIIPPRFSQLILRPDKNKLSNRTYRIEYRMLITVLYYFKGKEKR